MAFKTFAPGVLTSSDVNTFLMQQAVITCTSSTRPSSPVEGMTIYETDTDALAIYTGSAWQYRGYYEDYTPTISGTGWSLGNATISGNFCRIGDFVHGRAEIVFGSTTVFGSQRLEISVPVPMSSTHDFGEIVGAGYAADISLSQASMMVAMPSQTPRVFGMRIIKADATYAGFADLISTVPFTWSGSDADQLRFSFQYKAA